MSSKPKNILTKAKHKNLDVKIYHSAYLSGATIVISIPCTEGLDSSVLATLKGKVCDEDKGVLYKYTELTVLFHALHAYITSQLKLPASVKTTGLVNVYCHYYNKQFNMVFILGKGSVTAVKNVISKVLYYSKPAALFTSYSVMMKTLGLKPNREEFNWCVTQINKCLHGTLGIFVVGKINMGKTSSDRATKLKNMLEAAVKKLVLPDAKGTSKKPESLNNTAYNVPSSSLAVTGLNGFYLAEYICVTTKGSVNTSLINNKLVFPSTGYDSLLKKLKTTKLINTFTKLKYNKLKSDAVTPLVLKNTADSCMAGTISLFIAAEKVLTSGDISTGIQTALK